MNRLIYAAIACLLVACNSSDTPSPPAADTAAPVLAAAPTPTPQDEPPVRSAELPLPEQLATLAYKRPPSELEILRAQQALTAAGEPCKESETALVQSANTTAVDLLDYGIQVSPIELLEFVRAVSEDTTTKMNCANLMANYAADRIESKQYNHAQHLIQTRAAANLSARIGVKIDRPRY